MTAQERMIADPGHVSPRNERVGSVYAMREQLHIVPVRSRRHALPRRQGGRIAFRPLATASDERLVSELRRGDPRAFETIYDRHHKALLGFCRHMLGSAEEAEDALQQVFVSAHAHLCDGTGRIDLKPWLYTIARNRCLSMLRARHETFSLEAAPEPSTDRLAVAEAVERREDVEELLDDLGRLPDEQRAALLLAEVGDLSQQQIAATLGVRHERVKALIFQARTGLAGWREARATECAEIQRELATLRGSALRRGPIRRHVALCEGCAAFATTVGRQRAALGAALPVVPTAALKQGVLSAVFPASQGAGAAGAAAAASAVAASGAAVPGGAGLGAAASGLAAKALVAGALLAGAGGAVAVRVHDAPVAPGTAGYVATPGATRPAGGEAAGGAVAHAASARSERLDPARATASSAAPATVRPNTNAGHAGAAERAATVAADGASAPGAHGKPASADAAASPSAAKVPPGAAKKESSAPKTSPGAAKKESSTPKTSPGAAKKESSTPKTSPGAAKKESSTTKAAPANGASSAAKKSPSAAVKQPAPAASTPAPAAQKAQPDATAAQPPVAPPAKKAPPSAAPAQSTAAEPVATATPPADDGAGD